MRLFVSVLLALLIGSTLLAIVLITRSPQESQTPATIADQQTTTIEPSYQAQVVFQNIQDSVTRDLITMRVLRPMQLWHEEQALPITRMIVVAQTETPQTPYLVAADLADGNIHSYAIPVVDQQVGWYLPSCSQPCRFTETFSTLYPDIVQLATRSR